MNERISVATIQNPEFVNLQPMDINPLMSKCEVKVLYVGQNRNRSCITKEVATKMSKTLRGCPIVGHYIEHKEDFGDHGDQVTINGEGVKFEKLTKPYGFIAPDAKVWFQFFEDQDEFGNTCVREYLMTEGFLWTGQFEECQRVLENNNPQSMELDEKTLQGNWSTDYNKNVEFFIINDAVFSKLCILGEDVEPCFEGANVSAPTLSSQFSNDNFMKEMFSMLKELKYALNKNEGGEQMAVQKLDNNNQPTSYENQDNVEKPAVVFEDGGDASSTEPATDGVDAQSDEGVEEPAETTPTEPAEGSQDETSAVVDGVTLTEEDEKILEGLDESYAPEGETVAEALVKDGATNVPSSILQNSKAKDDEEEKKEDKDDKSASDKTEDNTEDKKDSSNDKEEEDDDKKKKKNFSLEDYEELQTKFAALEEENKALKAFKQEVENKEKDELIASFYMLSDEDKKEVIDNKTNYSLREIKAELSMICVDKKINFNVEESKKNEEPITYNLNTRQADTTPAWLSRVQEVHDAKANNL